MPYEPLRIIMTGNVPVDLGCAIAELCSKHMEKPLALISSHPIAQRFNATLVIVEESDLTEKQKKGISV